MKRTAVSAAVVALSLGTGATGLGQVTNYASGLVPNWDQPHHYPDPIGFDATGPGPWFPGAPFSAWCAPTSTAMLMGYWEDYHGRVMLGDGSPDGLQCMPGGYGGPLWGAGPAWHDYCADGFAGSPNPHPLRGARQVNDLGWYMDTNDIGDPGLPNGPHVGTQILDSIIGTINFVAANPLPQTFQIVIWGVHPMFGGVPMQVLADMCKGEIDGNRLVVAHFLHWAVIGPPGPGEGVGNEVSESQFGFSDYVWGSPNPNGPYGEQYNMRDDPEGLGHAVTVVGYTAVGQVVTHLIVHDNWSGTVRNVRVPVQGSPLVAITTVKTVGFNLSTSVLTAGQNATFAVSGGNPNAQTGLVYSTVGLGITQLPIYGVTLNLRNPLQAGSTKRADVNGRVTWMLPIPANARGRVIHFQALQIGQVTNVIKRTVL